jgi:hypothetical protein
MACSTANTAPIVEPVEICDAWVQINKRKSDKLTEETATAIAKNNAGREALGCPYEPPPRRVAGR